MSCYSNGRVSEIAILVPFQTLCSKARCASTGMIDTGRKHRNARRHVLQPSSSFYTQTACLSTKVLKHASQAAPFYTQTACLSTKKPSSDNCLVYRSHIARKLYWTYVLSAFTVVPAAANAAWQFATYRREVAVMLSDFDSPLLQATMIAAFGGGIVYAVHSVLSRLMVSIYYNDATKTFTAFRYNWRLTKERITFTPQDVKPRPATNMLGLMGGNFVIKGRPYLLLEKDFNSPLHYNIMVGVTDGKTWKHGDR